MSTQNLSITKSKHGELWLAASRIVADSELAVLITADAAGMSRATWMNVLADSLMEEVITITAPTTQKIRQSSGQSTG